MERKNVKYIALHHIEIKLSVVKLYFMGVKLCSNIYYLTILSFR